ncbi:Glycosyltransferase involved in cell wall bisynthesis [Desulfuromusa kysingii]|uniref:Glycosyltransferase involved in cell wall bisynthesis n=1 Tax=Desulfuromusa kysingii TaxID=37625 RepID=A0A1H4BAE6_9BACT|nr:glycosyltransferase [Desulfuromusa kysingii]SEA45066.1 Glycosyltransferase involved in cell wall bisynthesis [Desulfuromusa kysingii]
MNGLFSVIVPVYNGEKFIKETLESALDQVNVDFEIIVIDDGSTDNTRKIVRSFGEKVTLYEQKNSGVSVARNFGSSKANGEYLAFLDADDIWMPDKLKKQQDKLSNGCDLVYTDRYNIGEIGDLPQIHSDICEMPEGDIFEKLLCGNFITNSSVVVKKTIYEKFGGYDDKLYTCEDWALWLTISAYHNIGVCLEPLVKYRFHAGGKSRNYKRQALTRNEIIRSILNTPRGLQLTRISIAKIWSKTYRTSAWASASSGDLVMSIAYYLHALARWPFDLSCWYDLARVLAGRA